MRRPSRSLLVFAALFGGVFVLAALAGFVFRHEPGRDEVRVTIEGAPASAGTTARLAGTVVEHSGDRLVLDVDGERVEVQLAPDVLVEELRRIDGGALAAGTQLLIGGEATDFGPVITGIVAVTPGEAP